jgi:hypothetical protein
MPEKSRSSVESKVTTQPAITDGLGARAEVIAEQDYAGGGDCATAGTLLGVDFQGGIDAGLRLAGGGI